MNSSLRPTQENINPITATADAEKKRKLAKELNAVLAKTTISEKLNDNNYEWWSQLVTQVLNGLDLDSYLTVDNVIPITESAASHNVNRTLLCTWLLTHIDSRNASRVKAKLSKTSGITTYNSPSDIWKVLSNYHVQNSSKHLFDATQKLRNLKQTGSKSLKDHLDEFDILKSKIIEYGGTPDLDSNLCYQLLESIHVRYDSDKRSIIRFVDPLTYDKVYSELLKTHRHESITSSFSPNIIAAPADARKPKCGNIITSNSE
ncbi:hypothetical protein MJO29_007064 [Puccinia striiformis f. sp. tritici]|nr:hypothetical protein MJO29_007064 [Puccinia striiformis f. sp. tritici]